MRGSGRGGADRDRAPVRFTVDIEGDWAGHGTRGIAEALPRLIELLARHDATATFFVVGDLVDEVEPHLDATGPHEVGSHGLTHRPLTRLTPDEVDHEVRRSRELLQAAGYEIEGFRAPFFARPPGLGRTLAAAGYRYDASVGSVLPLRRPRPEPDEALPVVPAGWLRDGRTPCALTALRLAHPLGPALVGRHPATFTCHLHEFLDVTPGWTDLPPVLRHLHRRGHGRPAWRALERLLARPDLRFTSCRDHPDAEPAP